MFGFFLVTWFVARHVFHIMVCWSVYNSTTIVPDGCMYGDGSENNGPHAPPNKFMYMIRPFYDFDGPVCYNDTVKWAFLVPLLLLQLLMCLWFSMAIRVALKVICGASAEDVRSDDEGDDQEEVEEEEFVYEEAQPLEEDVGVEDLDLKNWERRSGVKRQASSSGVSLPGHSDRKELLGRIGCDKQFD